MYNRNVVGQKCTTRNRLSVLNNYFTTQTPFKFDGKNYVPFEGVSMGSTLGPLFADFYVSRLENKLVSENRASDPRYYIR